MAAAAAKRPPAASLPTRRVGGGCPNQRCCVSALPTVCCATGRQTRFWEGGSGCRDRKQLNRNDARKFAGLHKTRSAKAARVGPKPWSAGQGVTNKQRGLD